MAAEIVSSPRGGPLCGTMVATSKNVWGPYGQRYVFLTDGGGHTRPFQDATGKWWTALWTWKNFSHRFGIIGIDFDADGTIRPTGEVVAK
jgi:hypothetical protein